LHVTVRDDGPGIAAGERDAVFRRFYRGEGSRHAPGNGLGLTYAVARMHGMGHALR
jgi:signal transduction histidine kinase